MALPEDNLGEKEDNDFFDVAGDVLAAPFRGIEGAFQGAYNLADYLAFDVLPDYDTRFLGTSKTMAGGAVEGIAQFATGFIPLFGAAGRVGALAKAGTAAKAVTAGAVTDFTFFNGQEARLSNLIQQVPELQNPVTEFLAYDKDEGELEGRMKNVLEGLGLEAVAGVFIKSLKAMKKARKAKEEGVTAEQQAQLINDELEGGAAFADLPTWETPRLKLTLREKEPTEQVTTPPSIIDPIPEGEANLFLELTDELVKVESVTAGAKSVFGFFADTPYKMKKDVLIDPVRTPKLRSQIKSLAKKLDKKYGLGLFEGAAKKAFEDRGAKGGLRVELDAMEQLHEALYQKYRTKPTADLPEFREKQAEPELQQKLDELGETVTDIDEAIDRTPRPFKTYEEEAMMDIIPKGAGNLKSRLMKKFPIKGADPEDVADVEKFIDVMGQRMFGDVSLSVTNKIPSAGRYNFGNNLLQIRQATIDKGEIKRTMVHELWHSLSRYLPSTDVDSLTKQFQKERQNYLDDLGKRAKDKAKTPSERIALAKELNGFKKGDFTSDNYRYSDVDEYFAEEMTDAFLKKLDEKDLAPQGTLKRIAQEVAILFKDMFASLKAKLGIDQRQKIFNDFIKQRNIKIQRQRPLEFGRTFAEMPEFKKGKEAEFVQAVPSKFRGYADELLKGGTPRLPQFALETDGDVVVLKDLLEKYYEANPEKVTVTDAVTDIDEAIETTVRAQAKEGEDAEKVLRDIRITQQAYREQGKALIQNVSEIAEEAWKNGYGDVSIAKLKNAFQQLLTVADVYRRIGRETAITLQARREDFGKRKLGLSEAETGIEGIRKEFVNNSGNMKPERMVKLVREHVDPNDLEGSLARLLKTAKKAQGKHFLDMPTEYWMNSILSGPKTQMVNIMGNALTQVWTTLEAVAGGIASGNTDVVKAVLASWSDGEMFKEAAKFSKQAFKEQDNLLDPSNRAFEEGQRAAITGQRLQEGPLGNIVSDSAKDSIDKYAQFIRLPSRLLLTSDEFFKQLAYRRAARLKAAMSGIEQGIRDPRDLAAHITKTVDGIVTEGGRMMSEEGLVREAGIIADKKGLKGKDKADFIIKYKDDNFNPDSSALMQYAAEEAQYLTFTKELQDKTLGKVLQEATNKLPYLRLVIPFVRTPTNILKFAFERTPFVVALKEERQKLFSEFNSPDPILRARARGKAVTGVATVGALMDVAFNNREFITGGGPSNEREKEALMATGWRPYSIKIGDTYYSYQRLDPVATPLGVVADIVETGVREEKDFNETDVEHMATALMLALTRNATNKSYLAGIQMWADALGDPDRYVEKLGRNYAGSFVPNLISQMSDYDTQAIKEARSVADVMKKKLGFRGSLDTKRNVLGEEYQAEQWMGTGFINPIQLSTKKDDLILNEMASLNHAFRQPRPELGGQIDLLEYENEKGQSAHDRRLELLKTVKIGGLTLRQSLNKLIKSRAYQNLSPESEPGLPSPRIGKINSLLTKYRKAALRSTLREYPELDRQYANLTRAKAGFRTGMQREDVLELLTQ